MTPVEFGPVIDCCARVLVSARNAVTHVDIDPPDEEAARDVAQLALDVISVTEAAREMLVRPFIDSRGAVLRRILEAGVIAMSEAAAAIALWSPSDGQWLDLGRECEQCGGDMRSLLSTDVHDSQGVTGPGRMSGAT